VKPPYIERLERQSELTRRRLDQTLDDLQLHLSPRYQFHRAWSATKDSSTRTLRRTGRWVSAHPLTLLTLGVLLLGGVYLRLRGRKSILR
jgi:hypothetical protein